MDKEHTAVGSDSLKREQAVHRAYLAAIKVLARRDQSVAELAHYLRLREHDDHAVQETISELLAQNYLNDERFAEHYAQHCMNRGHGPLSVKAKMMRRGIEHSLANRVLQQLPVSWCEQAEMAIRARFSSAEIQNNEQRATSRIARFLQRRGFSASDSLKALDRLRSEGAGYTTM